MGVRVGVFVDSGVHVGPVVGVSVGVGVGVPVDLGVRVGPGVDVGLGVQVGNEVLAGGFDGSGVGVGAEAAGAEPLNKGAVEKTAIPTSTPRTITVNTAIPTRMSFWFLGIGPPSSYC